MLASGTHITDNAVESQQRALKEVSYKQPALVATIEVMHSVWRQVRPMSQCVL